MVHFFTNWISMSNFAYIATAKPRISAENIDIKVSALQPNWSLITAIVLTNSITKLPKCVAIIHLV